MSSASLSSFVVSVVLSAVPLFDGVAQSEGCTSPVKAVDVNGTTLHYAECGEGPPVVFIHGSTGDLSSLGQHATMLAPMFRAFTYSRRFHHPNTPPEEGDAYALGVHVDDLAALIASLDIAPVHLVGHSYGGYVALALALEHPEIVRSLVLGEPPVLPLLSRTSVGAALGESLERNVLSFARGAYEQGDLEEGLRRFLNGVIYPGWFDELPRDAQQEMVEKVGPEHRLETLTDRAAYMPPLTCDALAELNRPTLLMTGEESHARFLLVTAELEACLEGESHVMIPGVGHGMFSNVSAANDAILTFLRDQQ